MLTAYSPNRALRRLIDAQDRRRERRDVARRLRSLAMGPFTTSNPNASLTVNQLLKQPQIISRDLLNVILQRGGFVADQLLVQGTPEQVAGGSMIYQRTQNSYLDGPVEEIAEDADWPRTGWTEDMRTEAVRQYGLEVPISMLAARRNQMDQVTRAERRLANQIVKFVDSKAITLLTTDPAIQTMAGSAAWTVAGTDVISDVAEAQELMDILDEGLFGSVLVLNKTRRADLLRNTGLKAAFQGLSGSPTIQSGQVSEFLGLDKIIFTNQMPLATGLLVDPGVAGTIADESVDPSEGWQAYDPGPGFKPIYVQVYQEKRPKRNVVAAGRWPAMALIEPKAVVKITGI